MCPAAEYPMLDGGPSAASASVASCLEAFLQVQQQRAEAYRLLDLGFRAYLDSAAEGPYRQAMAGATAEFQALSQRVLALEAELRGPLGRVDAADALRAVQDGDREKLRLTLVLQALRGSLAHRRFSWQHDGQTGDGCGCGPPAGEPARAEVEGASRESLRQLEACVRGINEAIDEVRQLREDLLREQS